MTVRQRAHHLLFSRGIVDRLMPLTGLSTILSIVQLRHVPRIVRHLQRLVRVAVHHVPQRALRAGRPLPERLPGWLLCGQEATGVHGLPNGLCDVRQQRPVPDVPAELEEEPEEESLHGAGQRRLRRM